MTKKRLDYLDMAKGIAIILVVLGHIAFGNNALCIWLYSFHLPLFFIISGMLINYKQELVHDYKTLLKKKSFTLLFPYFSFSILYIVYDILTLLIFNNGSISSIIKNIFVALSFYGISTLWFLPCLLLAELLFIFILKKFSHRAWLVIAFCIISSIVASIMLNQYPEIFEIPIMRILSRFFRIFFRTLIAMSFISFGYYLFNLEKMIINKYKTINSKELILGCILFVLTVFLSQKNSLVDLHNLIINNALLYYITSIIGSIAILLLCKSLWLVKPLSFYGTNSLIVMVTHLYFPIIGIAIKITTPIVNLISIKSIYILYFLVLCVVLILEYIIVKIINNYFSLMLGNGIKKKLFVKS